MKLDILKTLAVQAMVAASLCQTLPSQAATPAITLLHSAASQVYVSPGIAGFIRALLSLMG